MALLALSALTACGGNDQPRADPSVPVEPSATAAVPSAPSTPDPRSPEALAGLVEFTAPPETDPAIQEALLAYADLLRQFVIAQGLGDAEYPPLLARIDPNNTELKTLILSGLVQTVADGQFVLGTLTERVTDSAGTANMVLIDTCTDYTQRDIYSAATGQFLQEVNVGIDVARARVVMRPGASGWLVSQYSIPKEQNCA